MMEKEYAREVQKDALAAIESLSRILQAGSGRCSADDQAQLKKAVGLAIGQIQTGILDLIVHSYPDMDDLQQG